MAKFVPIGEKATGSTHTTMKVVYKCALLAVSFIVTELETLQQKR